MTKEMIDHIARRVVDCFQWLTNEEEWLVMERVAELLRQRRKSNGH